MRKRRAQPTSNSPSSFFDINIPHHTPKRTKLKIITKSLELGYTAVAHNHTIKASAISNTDTCTITPLSLPSTSSDFHKSVKFHRGLLGVPVDTPFKQFTRLTVVVDSVIQSSGLNSGNPVLKSYDLVAVRPLNQSAFDHACKVAEVDLIAVDFAEKVPFRMDFQTVKAAIKRGIYFEITYSHLISDVHTRRLMISNTKLLVEWTRGKNLILSGAVASASELRGPHDVANLSSLLGLSMKHAKAAISKNCRILLHNAVRKKQYYKNAIKVERISFTKPVDSKEAWFCDENGWDHTSSGNGDLLLDDTTNFPSASSNVHKASKAIDFASIADDMTSKGFSLKNWLPTSKAPQISDGVNFASIPFEISSNNSRL